MLPPCSGAVFSDRFARQGHRSSVFRKERLRNAGKLGSIRPIAALIFAGGIFGRSRGRGGSVSDRSWQQPPHSTVRWLQHHLRLVGGGRAPRQLSEPRIPFRRHSAALLSECIIVVHRSSPDDQKHDTADHTAHRARMAGHESIARLFVS